MPEPGPISISSAAHLIVERILAFAGERPFLAEGKSQKWLHAQDHPLSIDEVRELLNKNK